MIIVENHRKKMETLRKAYPDALILDVTSHATGALRKLSPFYPHMGIPVPFTPSMTAASVEGIWQGLKTFEKADIDLDVMRNTTIDADGRKESSCGGDRYKWNCCHRAACK